MKKTLLLLLAGIMLLGTAGFADNVVRVQRTLDLPSFVGWVQDEFIVVIKEDRAGEITRRGATSSQALGGTPELDALRTQFRVDQIKPQFPNHTLMSASSAAEKSMARHYKVRFTEGKLEAAMAAYEALDVIEHVEPIGIHTMYATPNDTYYDNPPASFPYDQWHYRGANSIHADAAWDAQTGDASVKVGILDSGTRYYHLDLGGNSPVWGPNAPYAGGNIFINPNETPGNGIDDDGNGYVDDIVGWDFVASAGGAGVSCIDADCGTADNNPDDGDGHGTHVSGTVAAITNNGTLVAGVAGGYSAGSQADPGNGVELIPCRIGYLAKYRGITTGLVRMDYAAEAMNYLAGLVDAGQNVTAINCSWGSSNSGGLGAAVNNLLARDVVIVVAAGNSNSSSPDYLGSVSACVNVAATDQNGNGASFTNHGSWVDIAAPGVEILSTFANPDDPDLSAHYIALLDGTSMSAPHVAGCIALLESCNPSLSATQKINLLKNNTNPYNDSRNLGTGIVDIAQALAAASCSGGPSAPTADFSGTPTSGTAPLQVQFTDLSSGNPTSWSWDFGDGVGTSTAQNPSYTYQNAGTYTVSLIATNAQGSDTETKVNYITVSAPSPPTANFSGSPTSGTSPLQVSFTDLSTGGPTSWSWDFGDGVGTSSAQNPSYTYQNAGTYTVSLTATNAFGSDGETKVDYITVTEPQACDARVSAITVSARSRGPWVNGEALVTVVDQNGAPVANATVTGVFNEPTTAGFSALTGADGVAFLEGDRTRDAVAEFCFEVTNVSHASCTYNSAANVVTSACESGPVFGLDDPIVTSLPKEFELQPNYPNPFNPTTEISFSLPVASTVKLEIYNIQGQRVATLVDGQLGVGTHTVQWDATAYSSGMYLYRLTTPTLVETRKMILLK